MANDNNQDLQERVDLLEQIIELQKEVGIVDNQDLEQRLKLLGEVRELEAS